MGDYLFLCNNNDEETLEDVLKAFEESYEKNGVIIPCSRFSKGGLEVIKDIIYADLCHMVSTGCDNCAYRLHMSSEDYTARAMLKEYCERNCVDAYFYHREMRPSLYDNLEKFCRRLKCDVSRVQSSYENLMEHIKQFKYVNKEPNKYNHWMRYREYMEQDRTVKAYDEFINALIANSEWKYMYAFTYLGWSTDTWENEDECIADELLKDLSQKKWTGDFDLIEICSDDDNE